MPDAARLRRADDAIRAVLADPAVREWVKVALADALRRDPLDALADVELLGRLLGDRVDALVERPRGAPPVFAAMLPRAGEG